jgi:hypothetical protein
MTTASPGFGFTLIPYKKSLIAFGGRCGEELVNYCWTFDTQNMSWTKLRTKGRCVEIEYLCLIAPQALLSSLG